MSAPPIEITTVSSPTELAEVNEVLAGIWGTDVPLAPVEFLVAIAHTGGYVAAARSGDSIVGASIAVLALHRGEPALHSHVTGVIPDVRATGVGRAIKLHQRAWAVEHDLGWITWTFDPLVRRNAWFNIAVLGADVESYLPSFYGSMTDSINVGDDSDRLLAAWKLDVALPNQPRDGTGFDDVELVATPDDVVTLRRTDPGAAVRWRTTTRGALSAALEAGRPIVGFTRDGNYVIGSTP